MKAMTRQQLADLAEVDRKTLYSWMRENDEELRRLGVRPRKLLKPNAVAWIVRNYGISVDE